jgi:hypothetical protein
MLIKESFLNNNDFVIEFKSRLTLWTRVLCLGPEVFSYLDYQNDLVDKHKIILKYWHSLRKLCPSIEEIVSLLTVKQDSDQVKKYLLKEVLELLNLELKELAKVIYENDPSIPKENQSRVEYRLEKVLFKVLRALSGITDNNLVLIDQDNPEEFVLNLDSTDLGQTSTSSLNSFDSNSDLVEFRKKYGSVLISNKHVLYPGLIQHILIDPKRNQAGQSIVENETGSADLKKMVEAADKLASMGKIVFYNSPNGGASVNLLHFQVVDCEKDAEYKPVNRFLNSPEAQDFEKYSFSINQFEQVINRLNSGSDSYNISFIGGGKFVVYIHQINKHDVTGEFWKKDIQQFPKLFEKGAVLSDDVINSLRSSLLRIIAGPAGFEFTTTGLALNKTTIVNSLLHFLLRLFPELEKLQLRSLINEIADNSKFFEECYTKNCRPMQINEFSELIKSPQELALTNA